jgi:hypothetical protein
MERILPTGFKYTCMLPMILFLLIYQVTSNILNRFIFSFKLQVIYGCIMNMSRRKLSWRQVIQYPRSVIKKKDRTRIGTEPTSQPISRPSNTQHPSNLRYRDQTHHLEPERTRPSTPCTRDTQDRTTLYLIRMPKNSAAVCDRMREKKIYAAT